MKQILTIIFLTLLDSLTPLLAEPGLDDYVECKLDAAQAKFEGSELSVTTGIITRTWKWTGKGLVTTTLENSRTGQSYAKPKPGYNSDWDLPGLISNDTAGKLLEVTANISDDDGFSNKHIEVVSSIRYEEQKLEIQHIVWVFPGAPGLRTQLRIKGMEEPLSPTDRESQGDEGNT